jgi:hypothetical protein
MTEIFISISPIRFLEASSHCLGNPAGSVSRTANEAHNWPKGFGRCQAGEEEAGHGRLE